MKKILHATLLLIISASTIFAQNIQIIDQGTILVNNTNFSVSGNPQSFDLNKNFWIKNVSGQTLDIRVKRIEIDVVPGTLNATCWDICPPSDTAGDAVELISSTNVIMPDSAIDYSFSAHIYPQGISGCSHFRYIFFGVGTSIQDSVDIFFSHGQTCSPSAVTENESAKISFDVFPNPAKNKINLSLNDNFNGDIMITNILGVVVKRINSSAMINNKEIEISDLENGLYFISLLSENEIIASKRIQIIR